MKRIIIVLLALSIQVAVFSQTNPIIKYLPADAGMIMSFDPVQLAKKVPGETFRQSSLYTNMMKGDNGELRAFLSDPSVSGIDFSKGLMLVISNDDGGGKHATPTIRLFGAIKNEALFATTIKKLGKGEDSLHIYGTDKILYANGTAKLAWNSEIFVIGMGMSKAVREEMQGLYEGMAIVDTTSVMPDTTAAVDIAPAIDTAQQIEQEKKYKEVMQKVSRIQREEYFALLTARPGGAMATNTILTQLLSSAGDIKFWNNGSGIVNSLKQMPAPIAGMFSKLSAFSGTDKTSIINFENGKITGVSRNYLNKEMAEVFKKYPSEPLNTDLARRLPKGKLLGLMMTSANTGMAKEMLQKSGLSEIIDSIKGKIPFDLDLLTSTFKNNMMLAVLKSEDAAEIEKSKTGGIQVIVAMPIADKTKFEKLKKSVSSLLDSLKSTEKGEKMMKEMNPVVRYNDNLAVLSLSETTAMNFLNDPGTGTVPEWMQARSNYPLLVNMNMKEIFGMLMGMGKGKRGDKNDETMKLFDKFDQLIVTGGNYENGSLNSNMEFRFSNPNENAMKQLFDLVNSAAEMSANEKSKQRRYDIPPDEEKVEKVIVEEKKEEVPPPPPPKPPNKVKMKPVKKTNG